MAHFKEVGDIGATNLAGIHTGQKQKINQVYSYEEANLTEVLKLRDRQVKLKKIKISHKQGHHLKN